MKKKLTKEQKQERKARLEKSFHILLYISLAFNILFIALGVYGCSTMPKKQLDQVQQPNKQLRQERNYKVSDFDIFSNESTICYDLTTLNVTSNEYISTGSYHYFTTTGNIILFGGDGIVWSDVNEIYVDFNVYQGGVDGNYIQIRAIHRVDADNTYTVAGRYWGFTDGAWATQDLPNNTGYNTYNGFYIAFNYAQTNQNNFGLIGLLENCFDVIQYRDLDLPSNWNIYEKLPLTRSMSISDSPIITNIAQDIIFAVGGRLYNTIRAVYGYNTKVYYSGSASPQNLETGYLEMIQYFNSSTNDTLVVYLFQSKITDNGSGVDYGNYRLLDANFLKVRLFGVNLIQGNNVSIMDVFNFSSNYYNDISSNGQFGDVFGLIGNAFSGLTNLLSITILPGITLGVFIMLPLVALIIFAILRVVKK